MSLSPLPFKTLSSPSDVTSQRLAADPTALDALRTQASKDPKAAIKAVASQFEALFLNTLMKQMRETSFDESENSSEMETYRSLMDEQMVQTMSHAGGVGIGDMLSRQIARLAKVDGKTAEPGEIVRSVPSQYVTPTFTKALQAYQAQGKASAAAGLAEAANLSGSQQGFVGKLLPQAQSAAGKLGLAPELLVAHAALETGWGSKTLNQPDGRNSHNLFGIKAGGNWNGATVNALTTEYVNGAPQKRVETFRAYGSYQEAFEDYARLLADNPRYQAALNRGANAAAFAGALQNGGYATDPAYARKLTGVAASVMSKRDNDSSSLQLASR